MQLNGSVFYNDWTDRQVVNLAPLPGGGFLDYVDNIGKAHTMGAEFDLNFMVTEGLNLQFGGYVVEAEIDEPVFAFSGAGGSRNLYRLFPRGPLAQGARIAGLPVPANVTNASFGYMQ